MNFRLPGLCLLLSVALPGAANQFEVASIKVHPMAPNSFMMRRYDHGPPFVRPTGNRFSERGHLQDFVMEAWGLNENQITGLPAWALSPQGTVYDIEAKAEGDATPTAEQFQLLLQSLLADRFQLKAHKGTKAGVPVYALTVGKDGPKFKEFHQDPQTAAPAAVGGPRPFTGTTIYALLRFMTQNLDQPVVDRTGLTGDVYDFDINTMLDFSEFRRELAGDRQAGQDYVLGAIRDKLGLKIESRKESMEVLVVDHVEEPSPN